MSKTYRRISGEDLIRLSKSSYSKSDRYSAREEIDEGLDEFEDEKNRLEHEATPNYNRYYWTHK